MLISNCNVRSGHDAVVQRHLAPPRGTSCTNRFGGSLADLVDMWGSFGFNSGCQLLFSIRHQPF
jgi:hypothetical protein